MGSKFQCIKYVCVTAQKVFKFHASTCKHTTCWGKPEQAPHYVTALMAFL